jgi:signal transduction histidine kinase
MAEVGMDDGLLRAAAKSGCKWLCVGFETTSDDSLAFLGKLRPRCKTEQSLESLFAQQVSNFHKHGISVLGNFIFGFPWDQIEVFDSVLRVAKDMRLDAALFHVLTPYPGTKIRADLESENRVATSNWRHYSSDSVVFVPDHMTPDELQRGVLSCYARYYKRRACIGRALARPSGLVSRLSMNFSNRRKFLKMRRYSGWPSVVWTNQLRQEWNQFGCTTRWLAKIANEIPDEVSVINRECEIQYANKIKRERYKAYRPNQGQKCWRLYEGREAQCPGCPTVGSMTGNEAVLQYPWKPHRNGRPSGELAELSSSPLDKDPHGSPVSAVEVCRDATYTEHIRALFQRLVTCSSEEEVIRAAFETLQALGYPRSRYYRYEEEDGGILRLTEALPKTEALKREIGRGNVAFKRGQVHAANAWYAVDNRKAVILVYDLSAEEEGPHEDRTRLCFVARTKQDVFRDLLGKAGSREWIDVPLAGAGGQVSGKFSIDCPVKRGAFNWRDAYLAETVSNLAYHALRGVQASHQRTMQLQLETMTREMGHSLKSRVALIEGYLNVLKARLTGETDHATALEGMVKATTFLKQAAVLSGRIASVSQTLQPEDLRITDLTRLVRDVLELFADRAVEVRLPDSPVKVRANALRLTEALVEILLNSRDFTRSENRSVLLELRVEGTRAVIEVQDNGSGIHPSVRPRLFEAFAAYPGDRVGLGLALARGIITAHGGDIAEVGEYGRGARFRIGLPLCVGEGHV